MEKNTITKLIDSYAYTYRYELLSEDDLTKILRLFTQDIVTYMNTTLQYNKNASLDADTTKDDNNIK